MRGNRILRAIISVVTVVSLFGWPYSVLLPVFARDVLHTGVTGYGFLMAANGLGALVGALTLASLGDSPYKRKLFFGGLYGFGAMLFVFALAKVYWLSAAALAGGFHDHFLCDRQHRGADARAGRTAWSGHGNLRSGISWVDAVWQHFGRSVGKTDKRAVHDRHWRDRLQSWRV